MARFNNLTLVVHMIFYWTMRKFEIRKDLSVKRELSTLMFFFTSAGLFGGSRIMCAYMFEYSTIVMYCYGGVNILMG